MARQSLAAHMLQHLIVMNVAALLFAVAMPLRPSGRRVVVLATGAQVVALAIWHVPDLYRAAHHDLLLQIAMQASLGAIGLLFWCAILAHARTSAWLTIAGLLITAKVFCLLGGLLAFSRRAVYAVHGHPQSWGPPSWGLSALEDQQLAGLVMMASCAVVYVAAAIVVFARWLASPDRARGVPAWMDAQAADAAR